MTLQRLKCRLLLCCLACVAAACDGPYRHAPLPITSNVVILGDSLTYGTGAASGEDYASLLARSTGWNVINAGVPGDSSAQGLARLPAILEAHDSGEQRIDLLIIALGGNDFLGHMPESETVSHLKSILEMAKSRQVRTALIAIPEFSPVGAAFGALSDHPLYAALAAETDTPLIEDVFTDVLENNRLKADPIHPNADGYRVVASKLHEALEDLGFVQ